MPEVQEDLKVGMSAEENTFIQKLEDKYGFGIGDVVIRTGPSFGHEGQSRYIPHGSLHTVAGWRRYDRMVLLEGFDTFGCIPRHFELYSRGEDNA